MYLYLIKGTRFLGISKHHLLALKDRRQTDGSLFYDSQMGCAWVQTTLFDRGSVG
jgi:hypothetical protein